MTPLDTMALNIVTIEQTAPASILKQRAQPLSFPLNKDDRALIEAMQEKLYQLKGVGLAAPQVNASKRIIAIYIPEESALLRDNVKPYPMHILINPEYEGIESEGKYADYEGCYSVSSKSGKVPRYQAIRLSYNDEQGKLHTTIENGFYARVLQHEIDHINGLLIVDRLTPDCIQGTVEEMMALRRSELSDEKKELFDRLMKIKLKK